MLHNIQATRPSSPTLRVGRQRRALSRADDATTAGKLLRAVAGPTRLLTAPRSSKHVACDDHWLVFVVQTCLEVLALRLSCEGSSDRELLTCITFSLLLPARLPTKTVKGALPTPLSAVLGSLGLLCGQVGGNAGEVFESCCQVRCQFGLTKLVLW